ncbi:hypothetical protein CBE90_04600 [Pasteurella multocida]|uniref:hypothetical protein n=1 Tax=Pasteurella multocida TaxID=747 RepID=UPI000CE8F7A6|nr:hypothetical protein [Pasteurella multocida]PPE94943.1 hypothetical protein CBE90_04600 [Pasteurella multocida]PPE95053.1 hypothetical protein CBE91_10290 [Pasteurella multocida]HDR1236527.1 hypothetical protein [Pasteurella multocida]HDR1501677.1 hypothetical protein [Pasteurella multocida]
MKIVKTFRIDEDFAKKVDLVAKSQGITFSQFVELACYAMADEKPKITHKIEKHKKLEVINLQFCIDQPTYKDLVKIIQSKNSTLSQEIYYRLSATLTNPIFDTMEFNKLESLHFDLNRLGNLFKMALNQKANIDNNLLYEVKAKVQDLSNELNKVLTHSYSRKL